MRERTAVALIGVAVLLCQLAVNALGHHVATDRSHVAPALGPGIGGTTQSGGVFDRLLDLYVRDGLVYYAALRSERAALDRVVRGFAEAPPGFDTWPTDDQKAFWVNAYNAFVLATVVAHYPIRGQAPEYPSNSIRQIPGAFDQRAHRVAGQMLTLDAIETSVLPEFGDPRVFLALGRGAVGSGRLRSETYAGTRIESQLQGVVEEFATTPQYVTLDQLNGEVRVSPIFGWREAEFVAALDPGSWAESERSPIEKAILSLIEPALFPGERRFLQANQFAVRYQTFDWRLNDLTGGRP